MDWLQSAQVQLGAISGIVLGFAVILAWRIRAWLGRARIKRKTRVEVTFDLELPTEWAAELTGRVLDNEGIRSQLVREGKSSICRVKKTLPYQPAAVHALCKRLGVIAEARGGGCRSHTIRAGKRIQIFEH